MNGTVTSVLYMSRETIQHISAPFQQESDWSLVHRWLLFTHMCICAVIETIYILIAKVVKYTAPEYNDSELSNTAAISPLYNMAY